MNKKEIVEYFAKLDDALTDHATLHLYGSAVVILLDAPDRTSLDIDVAGSYSKVNQAELAHASQLAGLPVNPDAFYDGNHLEWVGPLRLCLPPVQASMTLWQGKRLTVQTSSVPDLVASKLIRYDETDRADIQYLFAQFSFAWESVVESVNRLPPPFNTDALLVENLDALKTDMRFWGGPE
jgi:hypothetical protein